jgi:hypothetical protein
MPAATISPALLEPMTLAASVFELSVVITRIYSLIYRRLNRGELLLIRHPAITSRDTERE